MAFSVKIKEASKDLTAKERIAIKDTTNAVKLDKATTEGNVTIDPAYFAVLSVHNDKATPPDYNNYVLVDSDGTKYVTGSQSFWNAFMDIYTEMEGEDEVYSIEVYRAPSKNYAGKDFLTCTII